MKKFDAGTLYDVDAGEFPENDGMCYQVYFTDKYEDKSSAEWCGGILCNDVVICGCCGSIIDQDFLSKLFVYDEWADIHNGITGGEFPEELRKESEI